ncbi:MAG: sigma-70 family RNA polymerase sigma factor [Acidobacteriaceae bacterium]
MKSPLTNSQAIADRPMPDASNDLSGSLFDEAWHAYSRRIFTTTLRITRNREDAEDALQDAFLKAYLHIQDFDRRSSLSTWITRIAINSALMILRKRRGAPAVSLDDHDPARSESPAARVSDGSLSPEAQCSRHEEAQLLREQISRMPSLLREPLELRALGECSLEEVAQRSGLSVSAAKTRLYRARASLRTSLQTRLARTARESGTAQRS